MRAVFLTLLISFLGSIAESAPTPVTSSSRAVSPYWGLLQSPQGFVLDTRKTGWTFSEIPEGAERAEAAFRIPKSGGLLTVRVDESKKARNPKTYLDSWMTLYHRLGFDILGTRPFEQNGETAYVVDMIQKDRSRQARQAIFFKDTQAVIISCNDTKTEFISSIGECNKVIRSFRWTNPEVQAPAF